MKLILKTDCFNSDKKVTFAVADLFVNDDGQFDIEYGRVSDCFGIEELTENSECFPLVEKALFELSNNKKLRELILGGGVTAFFRY